MNAEQRLKILIDALSILNSMPENKILEHPKLVEDIKSITSSASFAAILNDISQERQFTKFQERKKENKVEHDLLSHYVRYQTEAFHTLSKNAPTKITELVSATETRALNANYENPFTRDEVKNGQYARAFNAIYSDQALQINTPRDPTLLQSYLDYSPYIVNYQKFLAVPTLAQTVRRPIMFATRELPDVEFENGDAGEAVEKFLQRENILHTTQKMLLYGALSPRGALIVPIEENGRVRFNVFNDTQFTYAAYGQYTKIDFHSTGTGVDQLYCLGQSLKNEVSAFHICEGFEPIYGLGFNKLQQLLGAAEAINIYIYTIKVLCVRAQIMVEKWGGEGQTDSQLDAMLRQVRHINSELSLSTVVQIPKDADFQILQSNFNPGFAEVSPILKQYQAILTGIAGEFFYGSENASFSANNFNMRVSFQNIRAEIQEAQIAPIVRFIVNTILAHDERLQKFKNEEHNFDIKFRSLYEPTEVEKLDEQSKKIDNLVKARDAVRDYPELEKIFKSENLFPADAEILKLETGEQLPPVET